MKSLVREFRLIPVVVIAIVCLFALKTLGLFLDGGYTFDDAAPSDAKSDAATAAPTARLSSSEAPPAPTAGRQSWAQEMFNFPDVTGSVDPPKPAEPAKPAAGAAPAKPVAGAAKDSGGTVIPLDPSGRPVSEAERAILERLGQRRQELDARARELDIRESLLRAAEKRVEERVAELKEIEARINAAMQQKDEAEAARFKGLVMMYENMKAKDAAKIFDRLDLKVLLEVVTQINPRRMADILAQMSPDAAERLTVELAHRASPGKDQASGTGGGGELPKIEGRRGGT